MAAMEQPAWEMSKENVKPVKSGRSAKGLALSTIGGDALKDKNWVLEQERLERS
jgi:hypothetical protein